MKKYFLLLLSTAFAVLSFAQQTPSADAVLKDAEATAARENKKVMVIFHASWCVWCRKMDASLNDPSVKDYFDKNYVITHLTIMESKGKESLENPGADEYFRQWGGEGQGIPYWVVLDAKGKLLADSKDSKNQNVGCPATENEVQQFISILKQTSSITEAEAQAVEKRFRKNS